MILEIDDLKTYMSGYTKQEVSEFLMKKTKTEIVDLFITLRQEKYRLIRRIEDKAEEENSDYVRLQIVQDLIKRVLGATQ